MTTKTPGSLSMAIRSSLDWLAKDPQNVIQWDEWADRRIAFFSVLSDWDNEDSGTIPNALEAAFHDIPDQFKVKAMSNFYATLHSEAPKTRSLKERTNTLKDALDPRKR